MPGAGEETSRKSVSCERGTVTTGQPKDMVCMVCNKCGGKVKRAYKSGQKVSPGLTDNTMSG